MKDEEETQSSPFVPEKTRKRLSKRATEYHEQMKGSEAEAYLKEVRGFTDGAIEHFRLGFVQHPLKDDNMHVGRIVIPYHTRNGVVALRSRSMPSANGAEFGNKYLPWMHGDVTRPFNTTALDIAPEVVICEGEMDTMTAWMLGYQAVGISGVNNWKQVYKPLFRYRSVSVLCDNDDDGQGLEFGKRVAKALGNTSIILMDRGYDLNALYVERGEEYCKKLISPDVEEDE